jgi:hypothetical protein
MLKRRCSIHTVDNHMHGLFYYMTPPLHGTSAQCTGNCLSDLAMHLGALGTKDVASPPSASKTKVNQLRVQHPQWCVVGEPVAGRGKTPRCGGRSSLGQLTSPYSNASGAYFRTLSAAASYVRVTDSLFPTPSDFIVLALFLQTSVFPVRPKTACLMHQKGRRRVFPMEPCPVLSPDSTVRREGNPEPWQRDPSANLPCRSGS